MSAPVLSVPLGGPSITVRRARPEDAPVCGRVCYDAFYKISTNHGFPPDFPSPDVAVGLLSMMFSHPAFYCVVAESDGCMVDDVRRTFESPIECAQRRPFPFRFQCSFLATHQAYRESAI
jgi:hypothetical protein